RRPVVVHPHKDRAPFLVPFGIREIQDGRFAELQRLVGVREAQLVLARRRQQVGQLGGPVDARFVFGDGGGNGEAEEQPRNGTAANETPARRQRSARHDRPPVIWERFVHLDCTQT